MSGALPVPPPYLPVTISIGCGVRLALPLDEARRLLGLCSDHRSGAAMNLREPGVDGHVSIVVTQDRRESVERQLLEQLDEAAARGERTA